MTQATLQPSLQSACKRVKSLVSFRRAKGLLTGILSTSALLCVTGTADAQGGVVVPSTGPSGSSSPPTTEAEPVPEKPKETLPTVIVPPGTGCSDLLAVR